MQVKPIILKAIMLSIQTEMNNLVNLLRAYVIQFPPKQQMAFSSVKIFGSKNSCLLIFQFALKTFMMLWLDAVQSMYPFLGWHQLN